MKTAPPTKTNAARLLDSLGIPYELRPYEVDPDDLTAISVARKIGLPPEQVFKTLLTHTNAGEHLFAVIPGDAELDLKKLAHAANAKKVELASLKEVEPLTGYIRGGVTVMGAKKPFPAYADETIEALRPHLRLRRPTRAPAHPRPGRLPPRRQRHPRRPH